MFKISIVYMLMKLGLKNEHFPPIKQMKELICHDIEAAIFNISLWGFTCNWLNRKTSI